MPPQSVGDSELMSRLRAETMPAGIMRRRYLSGRGSIASGWFLRRHRLSNSCQERTGSHRSTVSILVRPLSTAITHSPRSRMLWRLPSGPRTDCFRLLLTVPQDSRRPLDSFISLRLGIPSRPHQNAWAGFFEVTLSQLREC